jgi:AGCS family alanine or glycine:cation symporter
MATKFFEGTLAIMYKGKDDRNEVQGGPMYVITKGLGKRMKPLAVVFSVAGMVWRNWKRTILPVVYEWSGQ